MNTNKNTNTNTTNTNNFEIQTDHLISVRWPDQELVKKKKRKKEKENLLNSGLCRPG